MFENLQKMEGEFAALEEKLSDIEVIKNQSEYAVLSRRHKELSKVVELFKSYKKAIAEVKESEDILNTENDEDFRDLAKEQLKKAKDDQEKLEEALKIELLPKDPTDNKNCIIEIRAGAGGEEAALFAAELSRAYMRYAEKVGFKVELMNKNEASAGGIKEIVFKVSGFGAYGTMKFESGVHRVQRVPVTESQGRVHTSTITCAVLPEAEEVDVVIKDSDLRIDVFRAGGPGGQSVNTTDSAVRITHIPSGLVVSQQDEKSQLKNKQKGMEVLRSRLYAMELEKRQQEEGSKRLSQIGTGDRSEKIRTYNFPQDRITDHRIKHSWSNLPSIMEGNLDDIMETIRMEQQTRLLAGEE